VTSVLKNNTWKEELSILIVAYLMYLGYIGAVGPLEVLVWPFMFFVTAAFGMDKFAEVSTPNIGRKPTRSND